jgi:hypothetical protein
MSLLFVWLFGLTPNIPTVAQKMNILLMTLYHHSSFITVSHIDAMLSVSFSLLTQTSAASYAGITRIFLFMLIRETSVPKKQKALKINNFV